MVMRNIIGSEFRALRDLAMLLEETFHLRLERWTVWLMKNSHQSA